MGQVALDALLEGDAVQRLTAAAGEHRGSAHGRQRRLIATRGQAEEGK